nr:MAG TPA: hypothetical protein [Caudoviricetes sp.]
MGASLAESARATLSEHLREDGHAGNGYTEPRESWIYCSCGAQVWVWQQFYFETDEDPERNWIEHLSAMTAGHFIMAHMEQWREHHVDVCELPEPEDAWADFF